jgi:hypothetical protein
MPRSAGRSRARDVEAAGAPQPAEEGNFSWQEFIAWVWFESYRCCHSDSEQPGTRMASMTTLPWLVAPKPM